MNTDAELLRRYAAERDEAAFAEIVRRHVDLVYAAALRQLGGAVHRAEDVAQGVFVDLARNAARLAGRAEIVGWLYSSTHYAAAKLKRGEQRRQVREREAQIMQEANETATLDWERARPVIDEAMLTLGEKDREALLLRFFEERRLADVARRIGASEDAARMRVERALERLRAVLARRGIDSTAVALGVALETGVAVAAPSGLAERVGSHAVVVGNGPAAAGAIGSLAGKWWWATLAGAGAVAGLAVWTGGAPTQAAEPPKPLEVAAKKTELSTGAGEAAPRIEFRLGRSEQRAAPNGGSEAENVPGLAAGERLLAEDPEVRRLVEMVWRNGWEKNWAMLLADMGLRSEERAAVMRAVLASGAVEFRFDRGGWSVSDARMRNRERALATMRAAVGEARAEALMEARSLQRLRKVPKALAVLLHTGASPLTAAQANAVLQTARRHETQARHEGRSSLTAVDWIAAERELREVLNGEQLAVLGTACEAMKHRQFGAARSGGYAVLPPEWMTHHTAQVLREFKAELGLRYAWMYRELGLQPAVVTQFEELLLEHETRRRDLRETERSLGPIKPENAVLRETVTNDGRPVTVWADRAVMALRAEHDAALQAAVEALLGAAGREHWRAFDAAQERRDVVVELIMETALHTPVARTQTEQLERLLEEAGYTTKPWLRGQVDWAMILQRAKAFLEPRQLEELAAQAGRAQREAASHALTQRLGLFR